MRKARLTANRSNDRFLNTPYEAVLRQLEDEANYERSARPRDLTKLEGVRFLLNQLGNPENFPKIVHIAGTNGKGSTALILAALLKQAGT